MTKRILCLMLLLGVAPAVPTRAANVNLTVRFRDSGGTTLAVRAGVFVGSVPQLPGNLDGAIYQDRGSTSYFYSSGNTTISVPTGTSTTLTVVDPKSPPQPPQP